MKKLLFIAALFISATSFSQTIDTTIHDCIAARINAVSLPHGFPVVTDTLNYVGFFNYTVNPIQNQCIVNWVVKANGNNQNVLFSAYTLTDAEYLGWDGNDNSLITIIGNFLNRSGLSITFK